ncbi:MAG: CooT family nickel-binding protein [Candidatus Electrothrix sp. AW2]|nr:CooT family nickel-binding protein [Candidatus Electrothrix sp. AX1]MCI5116665.1 CooT family nickel-binding protein [Candidatus Electrothrix gigas]MCI5133465.1 CooT family nickel-binding protein [Candidatus Electrothrix gigas]MCI5181272.1 CooT family nickel-binding protein [Candidatus Electrothrix gigas]MCI5188250.1 CooT family nickel-binding protein [Candidatus Electrothrix gigas]
MCQLNVVMEREGEQETLMEAVTGLEVTGQGIILRTYFEEPMTVDNASIKRIDFLGGSVVLTADTDAADNNK